MYTKYDFVFYLNLKFWQVFNENDSSEYRMQIQNTAPGSFSNEKYDVEKKEHLSWKIANIVAFSSRRPYATKNSPFQDLHCTQNISTFYLKICKLIIKKLLLKLKSIFIILSEITVDNGAVKRWAAYFLKCQMHVKYVIILASDLSILQTSTLAILTVLSCSDRHG